MSQNDYVHTKHHLASNAVHSPLLLLLFLSVEVQNLEQIDRTGDEKWAGGRQSSQDSQNNYDVLKIGEKLMNHLLQAKLYFRPI